MAEEAPRFEAWNAGTNQALNSRVAHLAFDNNDAVQYFIPTQHGFRDRGIPWWRAQTTR
jgi:hypothetical protein